MTFQRAQSSTDTRSRGDVLMERLDQLARFSEEQERLTRLYLTPAHEAAARQVETWMKQAGMRTFIDAVGNVRGLYEGRTADAPILILGSHIDTVRDAGKFDGALGVLSAIQAVGELNAEGERLAVAVEVIAFGDEEGVRFPTVLTGSRAVAGTLDANTLDVTDSDGVSVREALQVFDTSPSDILSARRNPDEVAGYVELHIEQGPVLENEGLPVGVVSAISGASRFNIEIAGEPGHAGTVPMNLRRDAVAAAAEIVLAVENLANEARDLVATVGCFTVRPGAVNVIASGASLTLDIRSPSDETRTKALAELRVHVAAIAARRGVRAEMSCYYDQPASACDDALMQQLERAIGRQNIPVRRLPSGAGHDGLAMARLCPIGMLFVRCKGGISHSPIESITAEDAGIGVAVLVDFLRGYAAPFPSSESLT